MGFWRDFLATFNVVSHRLSGELPAILGRGRFDCDFVTMRAERMRCHGGCLEGSQGTFNVFYAYIAYIHSALVAKKSQFSSLL